MLKISLRVARVMYGYTVREVAAVCGVSERSMRRYEKDSGNMSYLAFIRLLKFYHLRANDFYIGNEDEYTRLNRLRGQDEVVQINRSRILRAVGD